MSFEPCRTPFTVQFEKNNPFEASLPLSPYEFNAEFTCGEFDIPSHKHSHLEIMIAESDSATHIINGKEYPVKKNSLCLFAPHHVHKLENDTGSFVKAWFVDFDLGFILARIRDKKIIPEIFRTLYTACPYMECSERAYSEALELSRVLVRNCNSDMRDSMIAINQLLIMRLAELVLSLCKAELDDTADPWWIPRYVALHPDEEVSTMKMAQKIGWSVSSLNRFFEKEFGQTLASFIADVRMNLAGSLLLAYPKTNIIGIAKRCGIESESTFYRLFKSHYGMTPKAYRNLILTRFFNRTDNALPVILDHEVLLKVYQDHAKEMTLKSFSRDNGLNQSQLNNDFIQCMGESFPSYVENIRLIHAKNLLSMTALPVDRIAQLVGYPQVRSFSRAFSKKHGETPTEFRKRFHDLHKQSKTLPLK